MPELNLTADEEGRESSLIRDIRGQLRGATPELTQGSNDTRQNKSADESGFLTGFTGLPGGLRKLSCSSCLMAHFNHGLRG